MKYVRIETAAGPRWGILSEDTVRTLTKAPFEAIEYDGNSFPLDECRLLPPCKPTKIVCVGKNYADHAKEMGGDAPGFPVLFLKGTNALNRHEGAIHAPDFVKRLDYEGELAVVIRSRAKNIKAGDFAEYVLGYTCLNDVTARDIQQHDGQWMRGKSMDGFCPIGPWIADGLDPTALTVVTKLNGVTVQKGNVSDLITDIPALLEFITASMTLEPGDVIATGTPAGVGPMVPGDTVEVKIEGIGTLRNRII